MTMMTRSFLWVCMAIICKSQVMQAAAAPLAWGAQGGRMLTSAACSKDEQCDENNFCLSHGRPGGGGSCAHCWRCCLFPSAYGPCPGRCACNAGARCEGRRDCGAGLFCSVRQPEAAAVCERCSLCTSPDDEMDGDCAAACPASGDMGGAAALPGLGAERYLFLAHVAWEIAGQPDAPPTQLLASQLLPWLEERTAASGGGRQAGEVLKALLGAEGEENMVSTAAWMAAVSGGSSSALLCPPLGQGLGVGGAAAATDPWVAPNVTYTGCFCNASAGATSYRCPRGARCSPAAYLGLQTEALWAPAAELLRAVCVACEAGQHCPEGTALADEADPSPLDCPPGYYCPAPDARLPCPPGAFCTGRSVEALTCDYEKLISTDPYRQLPLPPDSVLVRLRDRRDPLRGNYCPALATKPMELCAAGFYCPNTSTQLPCPAGHSCKAQSTRPWPCPRLAACPAGTTAPRLSYMALVIAGIVLAAIPLLVLALGRLDQSVIVEEDMAEERRDRAEEQQKRKLKPAATARHLTKLFHSMRLSTTANPVAFKYKGFEEVKPPITLEYQAVGLDIRPRGGGGGGGDGGDGDGDGGDASSGKGVRTILRGVSGSFAPRRLNAILGPSGCGKTTFLNLLCGKVSRGTIRGSVLVNGCDVPIGRLKKIMGFVPQEDIVHEDLTVRENLNYSARVRLPPGTPSPKRRAVVADGLKMLGLAAIQHYRVGTVERRGISGGQRKRVNIGIELVAQPSLLFLDEPTSGLDATSSAEVLESLIDMTGLGMNIIMVIHGPRFGGFLMFDQVLLLGTGGSTVYLGSPAAAYFYFTRYLGFSLPPNENPADIFMDIIAAKHPCEGNPSITTCAHLVGEWEGGGSAWVDLLESKNPTLRTRMSDIDPAFIKEFEEAFDELDESGSGRINAEQLVRLFGALDQELSQDDAAKLIASMHAQGAGARRGDRDDASSDREISSDDQDLTVTKQELVNAFRGVRDHGVAQREGGGTNQKNVAAKFYASQFLLPDLPEVRAMREQAAQERRAAAAGKGEEVEEGEGEERDSGVSRDSAESDHTSAVRRLLGAGVEVTVLRAGTVEGLDEGGGEGQGEGAEEAGGEGGGDGSYSPLGHRAAQGPMGRHHGYARERSGGAPVAEGVAVHASRRTTLSPRSVGRGGEARVGVPGRALTLPPHVILGSGGSGTSSAAGGGEGGGGGGSPMFSPTAGAAAAAVINAPSRSGLDSGHDDGDVDLVSYAARQQGQAGTRAAASGHAHTHVSVFNPMYGDGDDARGGGGEVLGGSEAAAQARGGGGGGAGSARLALRPRPVAEGEEHGGGRGGAAGGGGGAEVTPVEAGPDGGGGLQAAGEASGSVQPAHLPTASRTEAAPPEASAPTAPAPAQLLPHDTDDTVRQQRMALPSPASVSDLGEPEGAPSPRTTARASPSHRGGGSSSPNPFAASQAPLSPHSQPLHSHSQPLQPRNSRARLAVMTNGQAPGPGSPGGAAPASPVARSPMGQSQFPANFNMLRGGAALGSDAPNSPTALVAPDAGPSSPSHGHGHGNPLSRRLAAAAHAGPSASGASLSNDGRDYGYGHVDGRLSYPLATAARSSSVTHGSPGPGPGDPWVGSRGPTRSGPRARRASMNEADIMGRPSRQRRQSWVQAQPLAPGGGGGGEPGGSFSTSYPGGPAPDGRVSGSGGEPGTPTGGGGRGRGAKKDTLYVNSLLSNALAGAWAATHSVTAGHMNGSVARLLRPPELMRPPDWAAEAGEGGAPSAGGSPRGSSPGGGGATPLGGGGAGRHGSAGPGWGLRAHASAASMASMAALGLVDKTHSVTGLGLGGAHHAVGARLEVEETLASRQGQPFARQFVVLLRRGAVKAVRSFWPLRAVDTLLQLAAAFVIGLVHGTGWGLTSVPSNVVMCMVCLGVLSCVAHLRTFGQNRVLLWRESASGMSPLAYFLAQNAIDATWVLAAPALALGVYYNLTLPRMPFADFYVVGLFVCWWASGMAYLVSSLLPPGTTLMAGVFISLIFGAFLHGLSPSLASTRGTVMEGVLGLGYNRWAMEAVAITEFKYYQADMRNHILAMGRAIGLCGIDTLLEDDGKEGLTPQEAISFLWLQDNFTMAYCDRHVRAAYLALAGLGLGFRALAFALLRHSCLRGGRA